MHDAPADWVVNLIVFLGLVVAAAVLCFGGLPDGGPRDTNPDDAQDPPQPMPPLM